MTARKKLMVGEVVKITQLLRYDLYPEINLPAYAILCDDEAACATDWYPHKNDECYGYTIWQIKFLTGDLKNYKIRSHCMAFKYRRLSALMERKLKYKYEVDKTLTSLEKTQ